MLKLFDFDLGEVKGRSQLADWEYGRNHTRGTNKCRFRSLKLVPPIGKISKTSGRSPRSSGPVINGRPEKTQIPKLFRCLQALAIAAAGDLFDITTVVNGAYTSGTRQHRWEAEPTAVKQAAAAVKSTYETSEERAASEYSLFLRVSLSSAVALLAASGDLGVIPRRYCCCCKAVQKPMSLVEGRSSRL